MIKNSQDLVRINCENLPLPDEQKKVIIDMAAKSDDQAAKCEEVELRVKLNNLFLASVKLDFNKSGGQINE